VIEHVQLEDGRSAKLVLVGNWGEKVLQVHLEDGVDVDFEPYMLNRCAADVWYLHLLSSPTSVGGCFERN
jgi:hypothetical protein